MRSLVDGQEYENLTEPERMGWGTADPSKYDPLAPTIFHEVWWLNIVTCGRWEAVESMSGGRVVGRMPFVRKRKFWFDVVWLPPFTHFLGPGISPGEGSPNTRLLRNIAITRDLITKMPRDVALFNQKMHQGVSDTIAFQMEGFESSIQFTYELEPAPPETLWRQMRDKTRNVARKASKYFNVDDNVNPEEFIRFYKSNLHSRQQEEHFDFTILSQLIAATCLRGRGRVLAARDGQGVIKAAIFCVWDHTACYYLLSTRASDSGNGAVTLLLWAAIQRATAGGLVFDFDGLGQAGSVLFYTGFGATVKPRYIVTRTAPVLRVIRELWRLRKRQETKFY